MEHRIEEFVRDEKHFIYFDLSEIKGNDEYIVFIKIAKECIVKYPRPVLTITNIRDVWFDTETKAIMAEWMKFNEPYVKCGTVIGFDIKRMIVNSVFKLSGRTNMVFVPDKEQAIEWLLKNSL